MLILPPLISPNLLHPFIWQSLVQIGHNGSSPWVQSFRVSRRRGVLASPISPTWSESHTPHVVLWLQTGGTPKEKVRLVVLDNLQGALDHEEIYSAVAKATSIQIILAYAAFHHWFIFTFNVKTAFLNAPLEEVYCTQTPHFPDSDWDAVLRLQKALYGL